MLSAKGFHVFLQTEFQHPSTHTLAPVTHDFVAELLASSHADYVAIVAERNLQPPTVQLRLDPHASDSFDVPLHNLQDVVLDDWTERIRRIPDSLQNFALASNPNVLTSSHLHHLLQSLARVPPIRSTYARLARLVNLTQQWPESPPVHASTPALILTPSPSPTPTPSTASVTAPDYAHSAPTPNDNRDPTPTRGSQSLEHSVLPSLPDRVARRATRAALSALSFSENPSSSQSEFTYSWLRRSHRLSARLIRSQVLARHIHRNLISAFDTISSMPLSTNPSSTYSSIRLPTHGHRQRLLREINDLLPRIEHLATGLTKRPRTPHRRCRSYNSFLHVNPWLSYVKSARPPAVADGVAGTIGASSRILANGGWHCVACGTCNYVVSTDCRACRSASVVVDTVQLNNEPATTWKSRFDEAVKNNSMSSTPWIFAPSFLPPPPAVDHHLIHSILSLDRLSHDPSPPPLPNHGNMHRDDSPFFQMSDFSLTPVPLPDPSLRSPSVCDGLRPPVPASQFDLNSAFRGLTFNDEYTLQPLAQNVPSLDDSQLNKTSMFNASASMLAQAEGPLRPDQQHTLSSLRLGTSLPNNSSMLHLMPHRTSNGTRLDSSTPISTPRHNRSTLRAQSSARSVGNGVNGFHAEMGETSSFVGSLPIQQGFSRGLLFGESFGHTDGGLYDGRGNGSDTNAMNGSDLFVDLGSSQSSISTRNLAMEELAAGSYEASKDVSHLHNIGRNPPSTKAMTMSNMWNNEEAAGIGMTSAADVAQTDITSLEALAAASDAANGGTGSATKESLRTVSALVTPGRNALPSPRSREADGTYNMF